MAIREDNLSIKLLDVDAFIKANDIKQVTNPVMFDGNKNPTPDGLLSNITFGITKETRSTVFGYIFLGKKVLQPLVYKIWCKVDSKVKACIHGLGTYKIDQQGQIVESPDGESGIDFLRKNIGKIKFKLTDSVKRERYVKFLTENKNNFFTDKLIVIPPFYRDVKTDGGKISVGDINKLYISVMLTARALEDSKTYGFNLDKAVEGKLQDGLLEIYNWFGTGTATNPNGGMPGKFGIIKRANMYKTTDYGTRLIISAPNLNVETMDEMRADLDTTLLPLASAAANFYPFVIFHMRRFFENEFIGLGSKSYIDKNKTIKSADVEDYQIQFSDLVLKKELDRFIHGYSDRFRPIKVKLKNGKEFTMYFKGYNTTKEEFLAKYKDKDTKSPLMRPLTWCDVIFMATAEAIKNKMILITRYPIDTFYNQFTTGVDLLSTNETEPMVVNEIEYKFYPKIRMEDIGSDTSNKFIDTLNLCNAYLPSIGGDYDGDQVTVKGIYTDEANAELKRQLNSKIHFINLGGKPVVEITNEAIQSLYALTLVPEDLKLPEVKF